MIFKIFFVSFIFMISCGETHKNEEENIREFQTEEPIEGPLDAKEIERLKGVDEGLNFHVSFKYCKNKQYACVHWGPCGGVAQGITCVTRGQQKSYMERKANRCSGEKKIQYHPGVHRSDSLSICYRSYNERGSVYAYGADHPSKKSSNGNNARNSTQTNNTSSSNNSSGNSSSGNSSNSSKSVSQKPLSNILKVIVTSVL